MRLCVRSCRSLSAPWSHATDTSSHHYSAGMAKGRKANTKAPAKNKSPGNLELPEEEQWRIINETGILKKFPGPRASDVVHEEEQTPFADEVFNAMLLIIPMSFLLLLMEMYVFAAYGCALVNSVRCIVLCIGSTVGDPHMRRCWIGCCQECQVSCLLYHRPFTADMLRLPQS